jgi:hypothetical protein
LALESGFRRPLVRAARTSSGRSFHSLSGPRSWNERAWVAIPGLGGPAPVAEGSDLVVDRGGANFGVPFCMVVLCELVGDIEAWFK